MVLWAVILQNTMVDPFMFLTLELRISKRFLMLQILGSQGLVLLLQVSVPSRIIVGGQ